MACPVCKTNRIACWGDQPCRLCQQDFAELSKRGEIPKGGDIWLWGQARKKGEEALAEGKTLAEAQRIAKDKLNELAAQKLAGIAQAEARDKANSPDPRVSHLFD